MSTYFGIKIDERKFSSKIYNWKDIAARLFLCPGVDAMLAERTIDAIQTQVLTISDFYRMTNRHIVSMSVAKKKYNDKISEKIDDWYSFYGEPSKADFEYLYMRYGIERGDIDSSEAYQNTTSTFGDMAGDLEMEFEENYCNFFNVGYDSSYSDIIESEDDDEEKENAEKEPEDDFGDYDEFDEFDYDKEDEEDDDTEENGDGEEDEMIDRDLFDNPVPRHSEIKYDDEKEALKRKSIMDVQEMAAKVKEHIIGQDETINKLAVIFHQHLESIHNPTLACIKTPTILIGNTGVGKSEIISQFGRLCKCPVVRINSSEITPTGWRGAGLGDHLRAAIDEHGLDAMKNAIILFHEFDKITHHNSRLVGQNSSDMDADAQRDLMRLFETEHPLYIESNPQTPFGDSYHLPTDNLLIIFDGAFAGINSIIEKRLKLTKTVGFNCSAKSETDGDAILKQINLQDLTEWGFMPELLGRIGSFCVLNSLSTDTMKEIIEKTHGNILKAHVAYAKSHGITLEISEDATNTIARMAHESGLGARALKTIIANCLNQLYYENLGNDGDERKFVIDAEFVRNAVAKSR